MQTVRRGDTSQTVRILQRLIGATPDGQFGPQTETKVKAFQTANGLAVDGIVGLQTWGALAKAQPLVKAGSKGAPVSAVQDILGITIDGNFGAQTERSVMAAQDNGALESDGQVGPKTWMYLLVTYNMQPASGAANPVRPVDYKQFDARWRYVMFSNHGDATQTIKSSGCGPTAMADILATWFDPAITPVETCKMAVDGGFRTYSSGTTYAFFDWIAGKYPFSKYGQTAYTDVAIDALKKGALVIAVMGPGYWTKQGHYICLWKYDAATDRIYACDPGSSTRTYSSATIFRNESKRYFVFYR
jgi:peptidoglycan hydrolase-like protein with peptidoglycan-binding domain